jgi:hypothetical protein
MQRPLLKFVCFFICLIAFPYSSLANNTSVLQRADSLYEVKRYTESLHLYEELYANGLSSKAMLLKMAFIHEGLENKSEALFFLNRYFFESKDKLALQKIDEIADRYSLSGYNSRESDLLYGFYHRNFDFIQYVLASLMILIIVLGFYHKMKKQLNRSLLLIMMLFTSLLLVAHTNVGSRWKLGITQNDATVLMKGPSAASGVYSVVPAGTRFNIVNQKDNWLVVKTEKGKAYVRESALRKIEL